MPRLKPKTPAKPDTTVSVTALADQKKVAEVSMDWCASATASPLLLAQVVHSGEQRRRIRRAHTKDRAEVRGGGRKPWRQKGTGRSRHGSSRSPLWVGGGTTFGPRSRHEYRNRLPVAMRQRALRAALGEALRQEQLQVIRMGQDLPAKTRDLAKMLPKNTRALLIITTPDHFKSLHRVSTNMPNVAVVAVPHLTVVDVVSAKQVWLDEEALPGVRRHGAWKN